MQFLDEDRRYCQVSKYKLFAALKIQTQYIELEKISGRCIAIRGEAKFQMIYRNPIAMSTYFFHKKNCSSTQNSGPALGDF